MLQAVDAVDPGKMATYIGALVALQAADEMPFDIFVGKRADLGQGILQVIFAECSLAGAEGSRHVARRFGLAHGKQHDLAWRTASRHGGAVDALLHMCQSFGNLVHHTSIIALIGPKRGRRRQSRLNSGGPLSINHTNDYVNHFWLLREHYGYC